MSIPARIGNWIDGRETEAVGGGEFEKRSPVTGETLTRVARSTVADVEQAVAAGKSVV